MVLSISPTDTERKSVTHSPGSWVGAGPSDAICLLFMRNKVHLEIQCDMCNRASPTIRKHITKVQAATQAVASQVL